MKLARIVAAIAIALPLALAGASPALADEAECNGSSFSSDNGREYLELDRKYVPPPLRVVTPDCVSHVADRELRDDAYEYNMVWVDVDYAEFVRVVRAFEEAGWGTNLIQTADLGDGSQSFDPGLSADDLEALPEPPRFAGGRFSDIRTGEDIVSIEYFDGVTDSADFDFTEPNLLVNFIGTRTFNAQGIADPSILSNLRTIGESVPTPAQAAVAGGSAVMLMLIVGWPGNLLGSVVKARYDSVAAWLARGRAAKPEKEKRNLPSWLIWPGFVLSSIIAGFVDPDYGLNLMSARVLVSGLLSFIIFNFAAWMLTRRIIHRLEPESKPYIKFRWGSLLILLGAVVIARLLQFDPGVIFGLVSGLAFGMALAKSRDALVVLLGAGFGLTASLIAWVGYSLLAPVTADSGAVAVVFASEFLAGVTVQGISSLPIALLPFAVLNGGKVFRWKRWVWAIAYVIGLVAFMLVLLSVPKSWGEIGGDFTRWLILFVSAGVIAVVVWAIDQAIAAKKKASAAS